LGDWRLCEVRVLCKVVAETEASTRAAPTGVGFGGGRLREMRVPCKFVAETEGSHKDCPYRRWFGRSVLLGCDSHGLVQRLCDVCHCSRCILSLPTANGEI
jgi:hypothetical protein